MTEKIYYVDGAYVPASEASIPITDLAIVRGYGVFDYFRTYGGLPIQLERNLNRFRRSAEVLGMAFPWDNEMLAAVVYETLARNNFEEASVRTIATGGDAADFITPEASPRLMVYVEPLKPLPATWYEDGVKVITVEEERYLPGAKSLNYIPAIMALRVARDAGAVEALYRDRDGFIREGTTTNVFVYMGDGQVLTPAAGILPGVTRGRILEILAEGHTVTERPLTNADLMDAEEVIITAANKQVVPVVMMDDHRYSDRPGPWSRHIAERFQAYVEAAAAERDAQTA